MEKGEYMRPVLGILGGSGVASVNKLLYNLEMHYAKQTGTAPGGDYNQPEIILYSATKTPSRSLYLEGGGRALLKSIKLLQKN